MEVNLDIINKALYKILPSLKKFVGSTLMERDSKNWWKNYVIRKLSDISISNLPKDGSYEECIDSLDILACLNIIIKNWIDIFKDKFKNDKTYFNYAHNIIEIRNKTAHFKDVKIFTYKYTKHALENIELFMELIDLKISEELNLLISQIEIQKTTNTVIKPNITSNNHDNLKPINPNFACKIFLFPIHNFIEERGSIYNATRQFWDIKEKYRNISEFQYAVGLVNGISKGAFKIHRWIYDQVERKYVFEGDEITEFENFSWKKQIDNRYWNYGQHFVVEFDGKGKYKLIRPNKEQWFDC